jgi:hypothetical protein
MAYPGWLAGYDPQNVSLIYAIILRKRYNDYYTIIKKFEQF